LLALVYYDKSIRNGDEGLNKTSKMGLFGAIHRRIPIQDGNMASLLIIQFEEYPIFSGWVHPTVSATMEAAPPKR